MQAGALAPEGLMMHQALIPYDKIERSAFVARDKGRWSAFVDGRLLVQEDPRVDNFFPGLFAFEAMRLPPA